MPKCPLCSNDELSTDREPICASCARAHALPPRSETLRPRRPCAGCGHTKIVRVHVLRHRNDDDRPPVVAPLAATFAHHLSKATLFVPNRVATVDVDSPIGLFEAYVCRKCGYTELYTRDAASIPIGPEYGTEELDMGGDTPYRG